MRRAFAVMVCCGVMGAQQISDVLKLDGPQLQTSPTLTVGGSEMKGDSQLMDNSGKIVAARGKDGIVHLAGKPEDVVGLLFDVVIADSQESMELQKQEHAATERCFQGWQHSLDRIQEALKPPFDKGRKP